VANSAWEELRDLLETEVAAMDWRLEKLNPTERVTLLDELTDRLLPRIRIARD